MCSLRQVCQWEHCEDDEVKGGGCVLQQHRVVGRHQKLPTAFINAIQPQTIHPPCPTPDNACVCVCVCVRERRQTLALSSCIAYTSELHGTEAEEKCEILWHGKDGLRMRLVQWYSPRNKSTNTYWYKITTNTLTGKRSAISLPLVLSAGSYNIALSIEDVVE